MTKVDDLVADAFGNPRYSVEFTSNVWKYTGEQRILSGESLDAKWSRLSQRISPRHAC